MGATVISEGTRAWLAELLGSGWRASVVEHRPVEHHLHLRLVDDLEEVVRTVTQPGRVGVLCEKGGAGIFIPCSDADEARALLKGSVMENDS